MTEKICLKRKLVEDALKAGKRDFKGMDLSRADLTKADLTGANLEGAEWYGADISNTILSKG